MSGSKVLAVFEKDKPAGLRHGHDVLVAALHYGFVLNGFRCIGADESYTHDQGAQNTVLPTGWNTGDNYTLRYRHSSSSMTFVIKAVIMKKKLIVHASVEEGGDDTPVHTLEVNVDTFIEPQATTGAASVFHDLDAWLNRVYSTLMQGVMPDPSLPGYSAPRASSSSPQRQDRNRRPDSASPQRQPPHYDPLREPPRRPMRPMMPVGDRDLDPDFSGYPGGLPLRGPGGGGGSGGMFVGPGHPMFGGGSGPGSGGGNPFGGGGGFPGLGPGNPGPAFPPGSIPPGARWDPVGPDTGGGGGGRPRRRYSSPGGGSAPPLPPGAGGEPDADHFRPPSDSDDENPYSIG